VDDKRWALPRAHGLFHKPIDFPRLHGAEISQANDQQTVLVIEDDASMRDMLWHWRKDGSTAGANGKVGWKN
jgi:hypothetical protein